MLRTTLINRTELGKFGLFFIFLITADSTICPPHSTTRLGEDTAASWYSFMFLRPHARICTHIEDVLRQAACVPLDKQCLKTVPYLHSSELNHGPDALWNHIEVLGSFWRNQRKI